MAEEPPSLSTLSLSEREDGKSGSTSDQTGSNSGPISLPLPSPIALLDPLQELCPSLDAVQALCLASVDKLPGGETFRRSRLIKAILKAASSGDVELLSWICYVQSQQQTKDSCPEAIAFRDFSWSSVRDEDGAGPVILAASSGHVEAVRLLIRSGAEVDERDGSGWTPLMWAVNNANLPLVSFLLSQGADSHAKTLKGVTCEDFIISSAPHDTAEEENRLEKKTSIFEKHEVAQQKKVIATDRQLIGDLIFEHHKLQQYAVEGKKTLSSAFEETPLQTRLRSMSTSTNDSGSLRFDGGPSSTSNATSLSAKGFGGHSRSSSATMRRFIGLTERTQLVEGELRARELAEGRRRALLDVAVLLQVDYEDLLGQLPSSDTPSPKGLRRRRTKVKGKHVHSGLSSGCGAIEVGSDPLSHEFDFGTVRPDQMLVFGESSIEAIINVIVRDAKPTRAPWTARSKAANVMFMCMRFAASLDDRDLLEELLFAFISAVEASLYAHPTELTHLAFWLYNGTLLLHYTKRDKILQTLEGIDEVQALLSELINEIYLFIVRDVERRIDKILQVAMLDHESIPSFEEIRYEDEWSFIKTIRGSVKGFGGSNAGGAGSGTSSPANGSIRRPLSQIFASSDGNSSPRGTMNASPLAVGKSRQAARGSPAIPTSLFPSSPPSAMNSPPKQRIDNQQQEVSTAADLLARPSPRTITSLLTSVLHVLQLYEINPCVIIQALSQVLFWVGCELFNRIITHKRYMCKNKAMQIRLNISALEDWIKTNALPPTLISVHFARVNQLVSWMLCQSSLGDFDGLIATLQGLRSLTPMQLRHVVTEYRYEQGESRMDAECVQYLDQLRIDWKRRQADAAAAAAAAADADAQRGANKVMSTSEHGHARSGTATQDNPQGLNNVGDADFDFEDHSVDLEPEVADSNIDNTEQQAVLDAQRDIDSLFAPGRSMNDYIPRYPKANESVSQLAETNGVEAKSEAGGASKTKSVEYVLLNSRDMLLFALPSRAGALIVSPGDAFGFGRGHFMGTGTPSLKSMRTNSLVPTPSPSLRGGSVAASGGILHSGSNSVSNSSRSSSPLKNHSSIDSAVSTSAARLAAPTTKSTGLGIQGISSPSPSVIRSSAVIGTTTTDDDGGLHVPDSASQRSGSNLTAASDMSVASSTLFPQGKGLAAGASWQPVPLFPEGLLEVLTAAMRAV